MCFILPNIILQKQNLQYFLLWPYFLQLSFSWVTLWSVANKKFAPTSLKLLQTFCFQNQLEKDNFLKSILKHYSSLCCIGTKTIGNLFFYFCCMPKSDSTFSYQCSYRYPLLKRVRETVLTLSTGIRAVHSGSRVVQQFQPTRSHPFIQFAVSREKKMKKENGEKKKKSEAILLSI